MYTMYIDKNEHSFCLLCSQLEIYPVILQMFPSERKSSQPELLLLLSVSEEEEEEDSTRDVR